jgi:hypothetical protein
MVRRKDRRKGKSSGEKLKLHGYARACDLGWRGLWKCVEETRNETTSNTASTTSQKITRERCRLEEAVDNRGWIALEDWRRNDESKGDARLSKKGRK